MKSTSELIQNLSKSYQEKKKEAILWLILALISFAIIIFLILNGKSWYYLIILVSFVYKFYQIFNDLKRLQALKKEAKIIFKG